MHACPCCGHRTLPSRGDYELCPVCWWEDDGGEPWEYSGPNGRTLVEAQQEYLAQRRPYRLRPGKVRAPRPGEARDPDWHPFELSDELRDRVRRTHEENRRQWEAESRRVAQEIADDPEGPFKEYNAAIRSLASRDSHLTHAEIEATIRELGSRHGVMLPDAYVELQSRLMEDEHFYHRHPLRALLWVARHGRPGTFRQRWREVWSGSFRVAG